MFPFINPKSYFINLSIIALLFFIWCDYASAFTITTPTKNKVGLVGHWTFDGQDMLTGTVRDVSGNNNHGSMVNMATATSRAKGKVGQGLQFDGVNDYVEVGDNPSLSVTGSFTISVWINTSSLLDSGFTDHEGVVAKYRSVTGNEDQRAYEIFVDKDAADLGEIGFAVSSDGTFSMAKTIQSSGVISRNKWFHVTVVFVPSTAMRIYINGLLDTNDTSSVPSGVADTVAPLWIGTQFDSAVPANAFDGKIDDVRIYNRALSVQEIQQLYNMGR